MDNRFAEVLEAYDFDTYNISRTRGAYVLDTNRGIKLLKCFESSEKKLLFENEITAYLTQNGFQNVDSLVKNKDGLFLTQDSKKGEQYIVKNWFLGEGFEARDRGRAIEAAGLLGRLHTALAGMEIKEEFLRPEGVVNALEKHTKEMKRVKTYIRNKKQKNEFEVAIMESHDLFYEKAFMALEMLKELNYEEKKVTHGSYTYHNVLFHNRDAAVVNFDKAAIGFQITDLYYFLRKLMEKNDWSVRLGEDIIKAYGRFCPISHQQWKLLLLLLIYPEKYWKIVNHYYNTKKCWIASRNIEKLDIVRQQEDRKKQFLKEVFSLSF